MKYKVVVQNQKGSGIPIIVPDRFFDYRYLSEDLEFVVDHVIAKYPRRNIYLAGFSLGASYAARFLSKKHNKNKIKAFVSVGNPFDVYKSSVQLNSLKNRFYSYFSTQFLLKKFKFNQDILLSQDNLQKVKDFNLERLLRSKTTFQFDEQFTFKFIHDLPTNISSQEYYQHFSCENQLQQIDIPVLFLQIKSDPIVAYEDIPIQKIKQKSNFIMAIVPYGGHSDFYVNYNAKRVSQKVVFRCSIQIYKLF